MKTNQIMKRPMGKFNVLQRTSDGFFDGNALLNQWNNNKANKRRRMDDFLNSANTKDFIDELIKEANGENSPMAEMQPIKTIKGRMTKHGKTKDQIWMHPYLFIKFAMWINSRFELEVIKFVYDQLIRFRHDAGDNYNVLTSAIAALPNVNYKEVATAMNWIVFNKNGKNLRQSATQQQLQELSYTEHTLASMVDLGVINNYTQLIKTMRNMYFKKYQKF